MNVSEVMTRQVQVIGPEDPVTEAAVRMRELDVGPLPVCEGDRLIGLITDRDIVVRCVGQRLDPRQTRVREVMTVGTHWCYQDDDVEDVAERMRENQIRRMLVLNQDKRLVGICSLGDLAVKAGEEAAVDHALEGISEPAQPII